LYKKNRIGFITPGVGPSIPLNGRRSRAKPEWSYETTSKLKSGVKNEFATGENNEQNSILFFRIALRYSIRMQ
jgi:hypothetical protein